MMIMLATITNYQAKCMHYACEGKNALSKNPKARQSHYIISAKAYIVECKKLEAKNYHNQKSYFLKL